MSLCYNRMMIVSLIVVFTNLHLAQVVSSNPAPLQRPVMTASLVDGGRIDLEQKVELTADATRGVVMSSPPTQPPQKRMRGGNVTPGFKQAKKRHLAKSVKEALVALERLDEDAKLHLLRQPKIAHSSHIGDDTILTTPQQQTDDLSVALAQAREDALCLSQQISSNGTNEEKDPLPEDLFAPTEEELRLDAMKQWKLEILKVRQERINDTRKRAFQLFGAFTAQKV